MKFVVAANLNSIFPEYRNIQIFPGLAGSPALVMLRLKISYPAWHLVSICLSVVVVEDHDGGHDTAGHHEHDAVKIGSCQTDQCYSSQLNERSFGNYCSPKYFKHNLGIRAW